MTPAPGTIRILIADDHTLVRRSLARFVTDTAQIEVVADVGSADEAIDAAIRHTPDVAVFDIDMPGISSFDAARTIHARSPKTKFLFLSAFTHDRYIDAALGCGALGYLTKTEPPENVVRAIRAVAAGQSFFSAEVQQRIVIGEDGVHLAQEAPGSISSLTNREVEVLRYIATGMSKKEIAQTMHLSVKTVENHAASIMARLDLHDRVALTRFAIREGLIEP